MEEQVRKPRKKKETKAVAPVGVEAVTPVEVEAVAPVEIEAVAPEENRTTLVEWFLEATAMIIVLNLPARVWIEGVDLQVNCRDEDVDSVNNLLAVTKKLVMEKDALRAKMAADQEALNNGFVITPKEFENPVYEKVTEGGEITVDEEGVYTVWNEVFSDSIFKTKNLDLAFKRLSEYSAFLSNGYGEKPIELIDAV